MPYKLGTRQLVRCNDLDSATLRVWNQAADATKDLGRIYGADSDCTLYANGLLSTYSALLLESNKANCLFKQFLGQCGAVEIGNFNPFDIEIVKIAEVVARTLGYTIIYTTLTNAEQIQSVRDFGFERIHKFVNKRTQNLVELLAYQIPT